MTDLERVRELLRDYPQMYTDDLDAHLKEDVERVEAYENLLTNLGDNFNEVKAELASLREENERYRAAQDGRFEDIVATLRTAEAENARLRERVKKLREAPCDLHTELREENARLREEVDDTEKHRMDGRGEYVAMGTFQRMAEEKLALKAELDRLREMVKSKVEGKKLLKAENARLREENKRLRGQVVLYRNLGGFGKVEGSS